MEKRKKIFFNLYLLFIFVVMTSLWCLSYFSRKDIYFKEHKQLIEDGVIFLITFLICVLLILKKNINYIVAPIMFSPFVFARKINANSIPVTLYISIGIIIATIFMHILIFKPKIKWTRFLVGIILLGICFVIGGYGTVEFFRKETYILIFAALSFVILFILLSSLVEIDFKSLCIMMTCLGILLCIQLGVYFYTSDNILDAMFTKASDVGWGISNNIAIILLFTIPFSLYLSVKGNKFTTIFYLVLSYIKMLCIVLTYSRGGILSLLCLIVIVSPVCIIKTKNTLTFSITGGVLLILTGAGLFLLYKLEQPRFNDFIELLKQINFETLNGRIPIYHDTIDALNENMLFGRGVFGLFNNSNKYTWGHNTIVQTAQTMGVIGLGALLIHFIEKYFYLIRKCSLWKIFVLFGFLFSDIYGMMDVSYYFVNYMIVLFLVMAIVSSLLREEKLNAS